MHYGMQHDDLEYVTKIMNGEIPEDRFLKQLKQFFKKNFDVDLIAFICSTCITGKKVDFYLWDLQSEETFYISTSTFYGLDKNKAALIKKEFSRLCRKYKVYPDYYDESNYFVVPLSLKLKLKPLVFDKAERSIRSKLSSYPEVKRVYISFAKVFVFYETDNDITLYEDSGLSTKIEDMVYKILNAADEYKVVDKDCVGFSSIQTLNEKYQGNMYWFLL